MFEKEASPLGLAFFLCKKLIFIYALVNEK